MRRRGFTLVELLVSILVLLAIIAATARIFGATSKVSTIGEANADLQTLATAVERTIRRDIARIHRQGFLVIQCVAVRNDVHRSMGWPAGSVTPPLLDPSKPADQFIRCDQVCFITQGQEPSKNFEGSGEGSVVGRQSGFSVETYRNDPLVLNTESGAWEQFVRIGHGVQFPQLVTDPLQTTRRPDADLFSYPQGQGPVVPWTWQPPGNPRLTYAFYHVSAEPNPNRVSGSQPEARRWTLSRQSVLLADDGGTGDGGPLFYRKSNFGSDPANSVPSLAQRDTAIKADYAPITRREWIPEGRLHPDRRLMTSRADIAATSRVDLKTFLETGRDLGALNGATLPWNVESRPAGSPDGEVRERLLNTLFGAPVTGETMRGMWGWPRAERTAPSMDRTDLMTVANTLVGNCSFFQVDWTWTEGTGRQLTPDASPMIADAPPQQGQNAVVADVPMPGVMLSRWPAPVTGYSGSIPLSPGITPRVPWFGMPDSLFPPSQRRGVTMLAGALPEDRPRSLPEARSPGGQTSYATPIRILDESRSSTVAAGQAQATDVVTVGVLAPPIDPIRIEDGTGMKRPFGTGVPVWVYRATFGFNGDRAVNVIDRRTGDITVRRRQMNLDYTPWPKSLRFTFTLHDPKVSTQNGRTYQFIVDLPQPVTP